MKDEDEEDPEYLAISYPQEYKFKVVNKLNKPKKVIALKKHKVSPKRAKKGWRTPVYL